MKMILLLTLFLFSSAGQSREICFSAVGKSGPLPAYATKERCESVEAQDCFDTCGKNPAYHDVQTLQVDDLSKPIYKNPYKVEVCDSTQDCQALRDSKEPGHCDPGDRLEMEKSTVVPGFKIFCMGITGYGQKPQKTLVLNQANKDLSDAEAAQAEAQANLLREVKRRMSEGEKIIAMVSVRNISKNLTLQQKQEMITDLAPIMDFLRTGSLEEAKTLIEGVTPDGTKITQADKDAILAEINASIGN